MFNSLETVPVDLHVVGDVSKMTWAGRFSVLKRLTHRLELKKDNIYKELLGPRPENSSEESIFRATILSTLAVSFLDVPDFFKGMGFGMEAVDNNLIVKLYEEVVKVQNEAVKAVKDMADEASKELAKVAEASKDK